MVGTDCYIGGRCLCRSVELKWVGTGFVATDLAKRRVDEVRMRPNYSIRTILLCTLSLTNSYHFHIVVRGAIVANEILQRAAFVTLSCGS